MLSMLLAAALGTIVTSNPVSTDYSEAYRMAQSEGKPLMVVVSSDDCPACVTLKANTLQSMESSGELADVSLAIVNRDTDPQLASRLMRGRKIPQIIVFSQSEGEWKRMQLTGYQTQGGVRSLIRKALTLGRTGT